MNGDTFNQTPKNARRSGSIGRYAAIALCSACVFFAVLSVPFVLLCKEDKTAKSSVLDELEAMEKNISALTLQRANLSIEKRGLRKETEAEKNEAARLAEREKKLRGHLFRQVRSLYMQRGYNWLIELFSGRDLASLILKRAYMTRWTRVTRDLIGQIKATEIQAEKKAKALENLLAKMQHLETRLIDQEEALREESEKKVALLTSIIKDKNKRNKLDAEMAAAEENLQKQIKEDKHDKGRETFSKGLLPCPVTTGGTIVQFNKEQPLWCGHQGKSKGWWMITDEGANILSPAAGKVVFSDRLKGFGDMVIISTGLGVHIVFAHLSLRKVEKGDKIDARDPIGIPGAIDRFYLEVRKSGIPTDPALFIGCPLK